jgi:hypothetical protein
MTSQSAKHQKSSYHFNKSHNKGKNNFNYNQPGGNSAELKKPVFMSSTVNSNSNSNKNVVYNNNSEYTQKNFYSQSNNGYSGNNRFNNNNSYNNNNNNNNNYQYNPRNRENDEKQSLHKSLGTFNHIAKTTQEENNKIKPTRDYTEIDLTPNTKSEELQRPCFINKNMESKTSNFVNLDTNGDLYLKKIQEMSLNDSTSYTQAKEAKGGKKRRSNKKLNEVDNFDNTETQGDEVYSNTEMCQQSSEDVKSNDVDYDNYAATEENENFYSGGNKRGGYNTKKKHTASVYSREEKIWSIATKTSTQDGDNYYPSTQLEEGRRKNTDENYNSSNHTSQRRPSSRGTRKSSALKQQEKEKVVANVGSAKNIKELFA